MSFLYTVKKHMLENPRSASQMRLLEENQEKRRRATSRIQRHKVRIRYRDDRLRPTLSNLPCHSHFLATMPADMLAQLPLGFPFSYSGLIEKNTQARVVW